MEIISIEIKEGGVIHLCQKADVLYNADGREVSFVRHRIALNPASWHDRQKAVTLGSKLIEYVRIAWANIPYPNEPEG